MKRSFVMSCLAFVYFAGASFGAARAVESAPNDGAAKQVDWEHMTFDERKKLMKVAVLPKLKKAFRAYDARKYKAFNCATCHGDGANDGKFKMPNAKLPKLPSLMDSAGFVALQQKKPEAVKFMGKVVTPKIVELLELAEWSPQNPKGFGCYGCHTAEQTQ